MKQLFCLLAVVLIGACSQPPGRQTASLDTSPPETGDGTIALTTENMSLLWGDWSGHSLFENVSGSKPTSVYLTVEPAYADLDTPYVKYSVHWRGVRQGISRRPRHVYDGYENVTGLVVGGKLFLRDIGMHLSLSRQGDSLILAGKSPIRKGDEYAGDIIHYTFVR